MKKGAALVFVAAGVSQESLIRRAKKMGFYCIGVDKNPDAPGFKWCDERIVASTHQFAEIDEPLRSLVGDLEVVGVINRSAGLPVIVSSQISRSLSLPSIDPLAARTLVEKDRLRRACVELDIPTPDFSLLPEHSQIISQDLGLPLVVKPAVSMVGKSGITKVEEICALHGAVSEAKLLSLNKAVILEEFLPGKDFSLFCFVAGDQFEPVCLMEELNSFGTDNKVVAQGYRTATHSDRERYIDSAISIAAAIVAGFSIKYSNLMVSLRVDSEDRLKLVEVHLDIGADLLIEEVFSRALNFDYIEATIKNAIGDEKNLPSKVEVRPTAIFYENGRGLIRERGFKIFSADSDEALEKKIAKAKI